MPDLESVHSWSGHDAAFVEHCNNKSAEAAAFAPSGGPGSAHVACPQAQSASADPYAVDLASEIGQWPPENASPVSSSPNWMDELEDEPTEVAELEREIEVWTSARLAGIRG
eukprot:4448384-Alexandrium_andersonii.AAC.1